MSFAVESQIRKAPVFIFEPVNAARSNSIKIPIIIMLVLQVLDFLLTFKGVSHFGTTAEGNPIIFWLMVNTTNEIGLAIAKGVGLLLVYFLFKTASKHPMPWVPGAIWGVNVVYILGAVAPWSWILVTT